ncbi:MAG: DNA repair protein RecN [Bacillota bacterium]|jgi:DNA repair protein RecN (Recombination protein N)|nr:DNA repair protein RecN [Bacillota bacterium]HHU30704.1 DNA repair protein RecN [Bacillota bacterium]
MLRVLEVSNLALMDNLIFYPESGLNVITGETGAGKSMLLTALSLLLGERAAGEIVRSGEESAMIQAVFTCRSDDGGENEIIFSREIRRNGPNICRLNGRVEPLGKMAEEGQRLVDLHAQNRQQSLLSPATQRDLLDAYGGRELAAARKKTSELYGKLRELEELLAALGGDEQAAARQEDFLRFQLEEIEKATLSAAEEEELEATRRRLYHARQLLESTGKIYAGLYEGAYGGTVVDRLGIVEKELAAAASLDESLNAVLQQVESAAEQLKEAARELLRYRESITIDEQLLMEIDERLEVYRRLKKKYGPTVDDVHKLAEKLRVDLAELEGRSIRREAAEAEIARTAAELEKAAKVLSALRQEAAARLTERVNEALQSLDLKGARFFAGVEPREKCTATGCDFIDFKLTTNVGEPLRPLAKAASGGEISRVMLAIKSVLAEQDKVETLIFDEIDAGIGGITVKAVAEKLKQLARHRQIICVTHQPIIAAAADCHFMIYKENRGGRTVTGIQRLQGKNREEEIARMLGDRGGIAIEHARKLLAEWRKN